MRYVLGLDIGIASVGWAVLNLDRERIEDLGVRAFTRAEHPKNGAPLAEPRRLARGTRRRLRRRAGRLARVRDLCVSAGLITDARRETAFLCESGKPDPWSLRYEGLDRSLTGDELARALLHLAKRRGFKSNRRVAKEDAEEGRIKESIAANRALMAERGYRTAGEMLFRDPKFGQHRRNRGGTYDNTVDRVLLAEEAAFLFRRQRELGNPLATLQLEEQYAHCFSWQMPFASGEALLRKTGRCTFERDEYRAPRNAYTTERFMLLGKVNAFSCYRDGCKVPLSPQEREAVITLAHRQAEVKYSHLRKLLGLGPDDRFTGLSYRPRKGTDATNPLDCEKAVWVSLRGYHAMKSLVAKTSGAWEMLQHSAELMDEIAFALTFYKTDEEVAGYLRGKDVDDPLIAVFRDAPSFSKTAHLSLKAMRRILPHLEDGLVYSEACAHAGYRHSERAGGPKSAKLPPLDPDQIRNPVVLRALTQARKVVNAVVDRYGSPARVHIEVAREVAKTFRERKEIEQQQKENEARRQEDLEQFREVFPHVPEPRGEDRLKWRLYREQGGKCAYSQRAIDLSRLLEPGYAEIDHILPYSRSFDDSMANKALVLASENRLKQNRTPFECFGADAERWGWFEAWVRATIRHPKKRANLLMEEFDERKAEEWKQRNLNDTQWISREFSGFVSDSLLFADPGEKVPVRCVKGQVTAMMRGLWGLPRKDREADDLHHAVDAAVVAALTPALVQRCAEFRKAAEMGALAYVDGETGRQYEIRAGRRLSFPPPWPRFRAELAARLAEDPAAAVAALGLPSYADKTDVRPLFVSRMPICKGHGPIHAETIRSAKRLEATGKSSARKALTLLTMADLDNLADPEANVVLYSAIRERMEACNGDAEKAFGDAANPFRMPTRNGEPGPIVRGVRVCATQNAGVPVRGGIADNGGMVRVDVFRRGAKFYLVPVYVADVVAGRLPDRAIKPHAHERDWYLVDDTYEFLFALFPYDLVRVETKKQTYFGYYRGTHRGTGNMALCPPNEGSNEQHTGVMAALSIEKYAVDVLGNHHRVKREVRPGVAGRHHQQPGEAAG